MSDERLSEAAERRLQEVIQRYPAKRSAVLPALYIAQEELGWINDAAVKWVASRLQLPASCILEVASFYTMYYKKPVGRYHIQLCRTLSCALCGGRNLIDHLREKFKVGPHEPTPDGMWSYEEVECLGSCGTGPMAQINDVFFEKLTPEKLDAVLERIEREQPDLRYSNVREELGGGMPEHPRSEVFEEKQ